MYLLGSFTSDMYLLGSLSQKDPVAVAAGSFFLVPGASDIPAQGDSAFPSGKLLHIFGCFLAPNGRNIHNYRV